jgi:hypothetical protein
MRFLIAGLALLVLGIGVTEYNRRTGTGPAKPADKPAPVDAKPKLPKGVAALLETLPPGEDEAVPADAFAEKLVVPPQAAADGFKAVAGGIFGARELRGGFGAGLFVMDVGGASALVRAAISESPRVLLARRGRIDALAVDGSTVFFAEGGVVASTHARGDEPVTVRARFKSARVTSLATAGDVVVATLMPVTADPLSTDPVGAVVAISSEGEVTLVAAEQVRPRDVQTDGKGCFWVAGYPPGLWRGALDGAFSSQLSDRAEGPLALDGDGVVFRAVQGSGQELRRAARAGGKQDTLAAADVAWLVSSSGLVRYVAPGSPARLFEVTAGAEPTAVAALPGAPQGLALGGTTLFVLTAGDDGRAVLWAK